MVSSLIYLLFDLLQAFLSIIRYVLVFVIPESQKGHNELGWEGVFIEKWRTPLKRMKNSFLQEKRPLHWHGGMIN